MCEIAGLSVLTPTGESRNLARRHPRTYRVLSWFDDRVSRRSPFDTERWVYLDCGKFHGLAETMDEAIRYRLRTPHDGGPGGPVAIAGPTCDSADVLYEKSAYELPLALAEGDTVDILSAGAYTTTYSSVGFNGFPPLQEHFV